jgi:hypothetical protein
MVQFTPGIVVILLFFLPVIDGTAGKDKYGTYAVYAGKDYLCDIARRYEKKYYVTGQ